MISRERLKHRNRIGKRMVKRFYVWGCDGMDMEEEANDSSQVGVLGNTKTQCSCWMCGNPRRKLKKGVERLTLQERRHQEAWEKNPEQKARAMAKIQADPKTIPAWYVFDLREPYSFCGKLSHSVGETFPKGYEHLGFSSHPSIILETRLASTSSKKVKQEMACVIEFHIRESTEDLLELGIIEKHKDKLMFHAWISDRIANHIHMTLISSKPNLLQFYGTDLYYR